MISFIGSTVTKIGRTWYCCGLSFAHKIDYEAHRLYSGRH